MSYHFRCNRCRGRNVMPRHWRDYKRPKRCKHCGHQRFYVDKERVARLSCFCQGAYHWEAHRPGSPMCERNPLHEANRARRQGAGEAVVAALIAKVIPMQQQQPGLAGIDEAPPITRLGIAVLGMLWRPARLVDDGRQLEVWIVQPGGALPVVAFYESTVPADLVAIEQQLQRIGTPVLARGFGLQVAVVEARECLRIGLTTYVGTVPADTPERLAA